MVFEGIWTVFEVVRSLMSLINAVDIKFLMGEVSRYMMIPVRDNDLKYSMSEGRARKQQGYNRPRNSHDRGGFVTAYDSSTPHDL